MSSAVGAFGYFTMGFDELMDVFAGGGGERTESVEQWHLLLLD